MFEPSEQIEKGLADYFNSSMELSERNDNFGTGRIIMNGFLLLADILKMIYLLLERELKS